MESEKLAMVEIESTSNFSTGSGPPLQISHVSFLKRRREHTTSSKNWGNLKETIEAVRATLDVSYFNSIQSKLT